MADRTAPVVKLTQTLTLTGHNQINGNRIEFNTIKQLSSFNVIPQSEEAEA